MKYTFGFIGCGNMGSALVSAVATGNKDAAIALADYDKSKVDTLVEKYSATASTAKEIAAEAKYIFLGVKPQMLGDLFDEIRNTLKSRTDDFVLVSMAAGVEISTLEKMAELESAIIRIMPNTPVAVGKGVILYCSNEYASKADVDFFVASLNNAGFVDEIPEGKIDAASAVSGCGPAFVYMFAEALADGAVECGLPRDKALKYAALTLEGAARKMLESAEHPGALKDAVCSPGGTTIAGVHALEKNGFRNSAMDAVVSSYERTLELK